MTPYFERGGITIYHGDCRHVLPELQQQSIDMVLADPPYGETSLDWDERVPGWPAFIYPLLKPSASVWCFGSLRSLLASAGDFAGWPIAQEVVWEKHNGSNMLNDRFRRVHELVIQFYPGNRRWSDLYVSPVYTDDATARVVRSKKKPAHLRGGLGDVTYQSVDGGPRLMRSVIRARSCHGYAEHPTQKPIDILAPLIEYSCPPGGTVLDPFMGSGSTLRAALNLGRQAIGIESEERFCEIAARRLEQQPLPFPHV